MGLASFGRRGGWDSGTGESLDSRNQMLGDPERNFMDNLSVRMRQHETERLHRAHRDTRTQTPKGVWSGG